MADSADEYRALLVAQADEQVEKLLAKVHKCEEHLTAARDALANADAEAQRVRTADLHFTRPTAHVRVGL